MDRLHKIGECGGLEPVELSNAYKSYWFTPFTAEAREQNSWLFNQYSPAVIEVVYQTHRTPQSVVNFPSPAEIIMTIFERSNFLQKVRRS